ncbi:putative membrane protein [Caulobacter sp. AP07]|uniref:PepSY domain-containing protein n=1 Tax=Caulobacter sp. AP07 TaxID=1144304 RepID=UPI000271D9DB|nr:PepSY domain-containing protein [Caulobacter sp. AP07]EJL33301.1 putative membrane protein [Caulobacter sp. AP07]
MKPHLTFLLAAVLALSLTAVAPAGAWAGDHKNKDHEAARAALARGQVLPLTRILAIAEQRAPGDVLKVELEDDDGKLVYEVKILGRNGWVRELDIDARTGAVLKIEND